MNAEPVYGMYRFRALVRNGNRLRWLSKARNVRRDPAPLGTHGDRLRYVLLSPEVGDYSLELANVFEAAEALASTLGAEPSKGRELVAECLSDEPLKADYARRRRLLLLPRRMRIGQRALWWVAIRLRRPRLVVETGVWYGLGSMVLLRALERNRHEGLGDGRLISFDPDPTAGWLVDPRHAGSWTWVRDTTEQSLAPVLASSRIDVFIHDTPSTLERERMELATALPLSAPEAVLISGNGVNTPALSELCAEQGLDFHTVALRPRGHWYSRSTMSWTVAAPTARITISDRRARQPVQPTPVAEQAAPVSPGPP